MQKGGKKVFNSPHPKNLIKKRNFAQFLSNSHKKPEYSPNSEKSLSPNFKFWQKKQEMKYMNCAKIKLTPKLKVSKISDFLSPSPDN